MVCHTHSFVATSGLERLERFVVMDVQQFIAIKSAWNKGMSIDYSMWYNLSHQETTPKKMCGIIPVLLVQVIHGGQVRLC